MIIFNDFIAYQSNKLFDQVSDSRLEAAHMKYLNLTRGSLAVSEIYTLEISD